MAIPYPYITNNQNHVNTGSYFNQSETEMFVSDFGTDVWYGFSEKDIIELSVYDLDQTLLGWDTLNTDKTYNRNTLTYLDEQDRPTAYRYSEIVNDFILYKNSKILVNPLEQLSSSFGITEGSYLLAYNFTREMAGGASSPLVIKDISPSRKEVKLVPKHGNEVRFEAFCKKKFPIKDVAALLIQTTKNCPYDNIFSSIKKDYSSEIAFLKQLLFLPSDGGLLTYIKNLYEDLIIYTNPSSTLQSIDKIKRTQGIKTYFQNHVLSNYESISDFNELEKKFKIYVEDRVNRQFSVYGNQITGDFAKAKSFLIDFFTTHFYIPTTRKTQETFENKYFSYLKNALNIGNNILFPIIDHGHLDERVDGKDPLTLIVKLKSELPSEIKIQDSVWVSNISIAPFIVNVIVRKNNIGRTIIIGEPNFKLNSDASSRYNVNEEYTGYDLKNTAAEQQTIYINKKISDLSVDYTDFTNFVIFSSAKQRLENFKTKISTWTMLSSSLVTLNFNASQSYVSGTIYSRYALEKGSIESQMSDIVTSFDGYESYLFQTGSYAYNHSLGAFISSSYIEEKDEEAVYYDKSNRDSLINNTPQHVVLDTANDEYLTFLNMVGHYFDNIYLYITNLPSEKTVDNDPTRTISKKMVDHMLDSFGWNLGNSFEDASSLDVYTSAISSSISSDDRTKAIRTRILSTLPQIYKTKGTEEAIKLLLACHGIPSELLNIREYGHDTYDTSSLVTYTKIERACLFGISGSAIINQLYQPRPDIRTVEFKLLVEHPERYVSHRHYPVVNASHVYGIRWDIGWAAHLAGTASVSASIDQGYYSKVSYPAWEIGFIKEHGKLGRIYAALPTYSSSLYTSASVTYVYTGSQIAYGNERIILTSSVLPLFDGNIFNIRLRRNEPISGFETYTNKELVPAEYDLTVQRNEGGRKVFRSFDSRTGFYEDNMVWDGMPLNDEWETTGSLGAHYTTSISWGQTGVSQSVYLALGNAMVWDVPILDSDWEVHCNDYSSFAYSGSNPEMHLITRMDADEPRNFLVTASAFTINGIYVSGSAYGIIPNCSEYYSGSVRLVRSIIPVSITYTSSNYYPLNATASTNSCTTHSYISVYPYEYVVRNIEKTYTTPSYGPNRFRNEKVKNRMQVVGARLDEKNRSTYNLIENLQTDSNLLGLYLDPQDAKNREMVKFLGNSDIVNLIADPSNLYSSSYSNLKSKNLHFNSFGDRRVLYNELVTLYKIYFDRSVFEAVKNVIPARSNIRTGVVIEPTILERSKYQHRPINAELGTGSVAYYDVTVRHHFRDTATKLLRFSGSNGETSDGQFGLLWGEFNINTGSITNFHSASLPSNLTAHLDMSYINEANFDYPVNLNGGYYNDLSDDLQLGNYGTLGKEFGYEEAIGVTTQENLNQGTHGSGSSTAFLVKKWDKYTVYFKSGSYVKNSNKAQDLYSSQSIWLYSLVSMKPDAYGEIFYTSSKYELSGSIGSLTNFPSIQYVGQTKMYYHHANTAKNTPNFKINTMRATVSRLGQLVFTTDPYYNIATETYFESFGGYPVNHYTHKHMTFSPVKFNSVSGKSKYQTSQIYIRSRQTIDSTVDEESGLGNSSLPIESFETSNINVVQSDNVINQ
jgi:hypothetical protein